MVTKRDNVVGQRVQAPAHGHNPLEIMTQQDYTQHPIQPPPELVSEWTRNRGYSCSSELWDYLATQAAQWGADMELEWCVVWLRSKDILEPAIDALRAARRPKPPSLKAQALEALNQMDEPLGVVTASRASIIRKALEELPDDN